jgi:hypothetical protein
MRASSQAGFDVSKTLPESHLRESHSEKLIPGAHAFTHSGHRVSVDASSQLLGIQHIRNLSENESSLVHPLLRMNQGHACQPVQMQDTAFSLLAA